MESMVYVNGLVEELDRYREQISIYPVTRKDKEGTKRQTGYGIAFYYDNVNGVKSRVALTAKSEDILLKKREEFLTKLLWIIE